MSGAAPTGRRARWRRGLRLLAGLAGIAGLVLAMAASRRAHLRAPAPTILLRDTDGVHLGEVAATPEGEFGYWPVEALPWRVVEATLALEDRRFWSHPGVDAIGVVRAARQNVEAGERVSGASTIAMQVARMQDPGPRTWPRKILEATTALLLTQRYGREAVLAHYLRLVPYGNRIHGIGYAARRYLDKPVDDLSWAETAFLAALPQAPGRTNPFREGGRRLAVARAERILDVLRARELMSDAELAQARAELGRLRVPEKGARPVEALHAVLDLEERARALRDDSSTGEAIDPLVTATLDLEIQRAAAAVLARRVDGWRSRGVGNGAIVVVELPAGAVRAYVGSAGYFDDAGSGSIDYAKTPRYPGSTLKPFLYGLALDRGTIGPNTVLDDLHRGREGVGNADDRFLGPLLPRRALGNSRNVPAVELLDAVGLDEGYAFFRELGLHDGRLPASHYGLGMAIGGVPVRLVDLVQAYLALAVDGRAQALTWTEGQNAPASGHRALDPGTARQIARWLSDPLARMPSFPRLGFSEYPFPVAVKTGTSGDYRDAWTLAWSDRYLVGAWIGNPDWRPTQGVSGYRVAGVVREVLSALHADRREGLADRDFPPPEGYDAVGICALTGDRGGHACDQVIQEWFRPGQAPAETCRGHVRLGDAVFVDIPARYRAWAEQAGMTPLPDGPGAIELEPEAPSIQIASPEPGATIVRDPEAPAGQSTLALRVEIDPPAPQVVWYVDDAPFAVVGPPYGARWPITPGAHRFRAQIPFTDYTSGEVSIVVR